MKALSAYFFLLIILATGSKAFAQDSHQSPNNILVFAPQQPDYIYGVDEISRSADLYRAVEEAASFKALADTYTELSENKAIENYLKALSKLKNFKISKPYADLSYKLSAIYYKQKKYDAAAKYLSKSILSYDSLGFKPEAGKSYIKLANIKLIQKDYAQAEQLLLKKGYPLCGPSDNLLCYQLLARTYHEQNRYSEAKWYYLQANTLSRKLQDTTGIITSLTALGRVKIDIKDYALALKDIDEADLLAQNEAYNIFLPEIKAAQQILQVKAPKLFAARTAMLNEKQQSNLMLSSNQPSSFKASLNK